MHDHARRAETWIHDSHILYVRLLPDAAKNSGRVSYAHETLIPIKTGPILANLFLNLSFFLDQEDII